MSPVIGVHLRDSAPQTIMSAQDFFWWQSRRAAHRIFMASAV
jgi:hypothetical protein